MPKWRKYTSIWYSYRKQTGEYFSRTQCCYYIDATINALLLLVSNLTGERAEPTLFGVVWCSWRWCGVQESVLGRTDRGHLLLSIAGARWGRSVTGRPEVLLRQRNQTHVGLQSTSISLRTVHRRLCMRHRVYTTTWQFCETYLTMKQSNRWLLVYLTDSKIYSL